MIRRECTKKKGRIVAHAAYDASIFFVFVLSDRNINILITKRFGKSHFWWISNNKLFAQFIWTTRAYLNRIFFDAACYASSNLCFHFNNFLFRGTYKARLTIEKCVLLWYQISHMLYRMMFMNINPDNKFTTYSNIWSLRHNSNHPKKSISCAWVFVIFDNINFDMHTSLKPTLYKV